jgi:hypothetical protein
MKMWECMAVDAAAILPRLIILQLFHLNRTCIFFVLVKVGGPFLYVIGMQARQTSDPKVSHDGMLAIAEYMHTDRPPRFASFWILIRQKRRKKHTATGPHLLPLPQSM